MKTKIRRCCFETNSSSQHSIVVRKDDGYVTRDMLLERDSDEYIYISNGKIHISEPDITFGRCPFRILSRFREKMYFAIAEYCGRSEKPHIEFKEFINEIKQIVPEIEKIYLPESFYDEGKTFYGDVDHQSYGTLKNFLEDKKISLQEFLICRKYIVICDGDERDVWGTLKETRLINEAEIIEEYESSANSMEAREYYEAEYQAGSMGNE